MRMGAGGCSGAGGGMWKGAGLASSSARAHAGHLAGAASRSAPGARDYHHGGVTDGLLPVRVVRVQDLRAPTFSSVGLSPRGHCLQSTLYQPLCLPFGAFKVLGSPRDTS